jgi:hypothetical protein
MILIGLCSCTQETSAISTSTPPAGIEGHVTAGQICPTPESIVAPECQDRPFQAIITILDINNNQVKQFQTDEMGYFSIPIKPGTYIIHPESGSPIPNASDQTTDVKAGQFTQILIRYDTGIKGITPTSPTTPSSGIEGYVTAGPICPGPVRIDDPGCQDQPYKAMITILDINNNQVKQFQTDDLGYFSIPLEPGTYILHPESDRPMPSASDQTIDVKTGQFTQILINYDTGIR